MELNDSRADINYKGYWCAQRCGAKATVYAIDPIPGGWGGHYCERCANDLKFQIVDRKTKEVQ